MDSATLKKANELNKQIEALTEQIEDLEADKNQPQTFAVFDKWGSKKATYKVPEDISKIQFTIWINRLQENREKLVAEFEALTPPIAHNA